MGPGPINLFQRKMATCHWKSTNQNSLDGLVAFFDYLDLKKFSVATLHWLFCKIWSILKITISIFSQYTQRRLLQCPTSKSTRTLKYSTMQKNNRMNLPILSFPVFQLAFFLVKPASITSDIDPFYWSRSAAAFDFDPLPTSAMNLVNNFNNYLTWSFDTQPCWINFWLMLCKWTIRPNCGR